MTYCAFFDLDETVIKSKSMLEVMKRYFVGKQESYEDFYEDLMRFHGMHDDRYKTNRYFYQKFNGINVKEIEDVCRQWFLGAKHNLFNQSIVDEIKKHQHQGAAVVIVSGSFEEAVQPIADYLKIEHMVCARIEKKRGIFTGNLLVDPTIGQGKANGINQFIDTNNLSLAGSYAYGDHISDLPMLSLVDYPKVTGECAELLEYAKSHEWVVV